MKKIAFHLHSLSFPWACFGGPLFQGQERLDFLDESLSA